MNILDYLDWRGDISFEATSPNEIDGLIFAWLIYYRFEDLNTNVNGLTISELAALHERTFGTIKKINLSTTISPSTTAEWLLSCAANTSRFANVRIDDFKQITNAKQGVQFAAVSFILGETMRVVAYRGTDNTIAGWKEDCYLAFSEAVPAQALAVHYLEDTRDGRATMVCGHSKGGNLAMYATLFASEERLRDVLWVYNFDGPGFSFDLEKNPRYSIVRERIMTIVPASSVVGMLLNHEEDYRIVESQMPGLLQHDAMFWKVLGAHFIYVDKRNPSSVFLDHTLRDWIAGMTFAERKEFVDAIFSTLEKTGVQQLNELPDKIYQNGVRVITQSALNPQQKRMVFRLLMNLVRVGGMHLYEGIMRTESARELVEE